MMLELDKFGLGFTIKFLPLAHISRFHSAYHILLMGLLGGFEVVEKVNFIHQKSSSNSFGYGSLLE